MWIVSEWRTGRGLLCAMRSDGVVFYWDDMNKKWAITEGSQPVPGCGGHLSVDVYTA